MSTSGRLAQAEQFKWHGFMLTLDAIPPIFLRFSFNPLTINDNFDAEFDHVGSPGARYKYPIFKGNSPRIVSFQIKFDQDYPISCELGKEVTEADESGGDEFKRAQRVQNVISAFESFKLPKEVLLNNIVLSSIGQFKKQDVLNEPSPPLVLLAPAVNKYMLGYVSKAVIKTEKNNRLMMPTRIAIDVEFLVTPDLIVTNIEDAYRLVSSTIGTVQSTASLFA